MIERGSISRNGCDALTVDRDYGKKQRLRLLAH
jgi:hypothetical protein